MKKLLAIALVLTMLLPLVGIAEEKYAGMSMSELQAEFTAIIQAMWKTDEDVMSAVEHLRLLRAALICATLIWMASCASTPKKINSQQNTVYLQTYVMVDHLTGEETVHGREENVHG